MEKSSKPLPLHIHIRSYCTISFICYYTTVVTYWYSKSSSSQFHPRVLDFSSFAHQSQQRREGVWCGDCQSHGRREGRRGPPRDEYGRRSRSHLDSSANLHACMRTSRVFRLSVAQLNHQNQGHTPLTIADQSSSA